MTDSDYMKCTDDNDALDGACKDASCCSKGTKKCRSSKPIPLPARTRYILGLIVALVALCLIARVLLLAGDATSAKGGIMYASALQAPYGVMLLLQEAISSSRAFVIPALLLLGGACSVASCCNITIMGALAGYAAGQQGGSRRSGLIAAASLMAGTTVAMSCIGAIIVWSGYFASGSFGVYSRLLTGCLMIVFGLFALNLLPIERLKAPDFDRFRNRAGVVGAVVFGFALGAVSMTCSFTCCSPALPIALGVAALMPAGFGAVLMMMVFALGYSVPLAVVVLGVSYGRWTLCQSRILPWIRRLAGAVMLTLGFMSLM
jgi:cytochrome c biogenesis protein CcdA